MTKKCLISGCQRESKSRGLCIRCNSAAQQVIKKSLTTKEELVKLGLMAEKVYQMNSPFYQAFREKTQKIR